jgi:glycosyltransferase involved in cell wall biosynthesis
MKVFHNDRYKRVEDPRSIPVAISVAFYNNLKNFDLMLAALEAQSLKDFLLIVSDDGSRVEVVDEVQNKLQNFSRPALHIWQEDLGFRKNRMLNWALQWCPSEYLVFVDQDCLPHPDFIKDHWALREKKVVLCGRRMELTPWQSAWLNPERVRKGFLQKWFWLLVVTGFWVKDFNFAKAIRCSQPWFQRWVQRKDRSLLGCNFSLHKIDLLAINGFDFRYEAPGTGEDSDVDYRLSLNGVKRKPLINFGIQYHVFHKLTKSSDINKNIFESVMLKKQAVTNYGLKEQLASLKENLSGS